MNNKNIYRLINPYQSNKVYEASTTLHGANKCYNELKKNNVNCNSFAIMNMNDNSIYNFNVKEKPNALIKENNEVKQLLFDTQNGGNIDNNNELKNQIKLLENRIKVLEDKINIV